MLLRPTRALLREASIAPSSSAQHLLAHVNRASIPAAQRPSSKTLYQHLASLPESGVGSRVRQRRWAAKGLDVASGEPLAGPPASRGAEVKAQDHLCYWEVTRVKLKLDGTHGKAWGRLVWRGKEVTPWEEEQRIPGALKYSWEAAR